MDEENILDDFLIKIVEEGGKQAWAGDEPPFDMDCFDLHGSTNYRLSPSMHGKYDVVWMMQITPNSFPKGRSWMVALDESIRLLKEHGKLVVRLEAQSVTPALSFPVVKAFMGRHIGIECETIYEKGIEGNPRTIVFSINRKNFADYQSDLWSFGILTMGNKVKRVCRFLESIRKHDPEMRHEILIFGPENAAYEKFNVTYVPDSEHLMESPYAEISKKKNLIIDAAKHPNLMIVHDRYMLANDFFSGFERYGYDFDYLTVKQYDLKGDEFPSYSALERQMAWGNCVQCNDYSNLRTSQYLNGGLIIMKTATARMIRFNECLFWNEMEDVELSKVCMERGIVPRINFLSTAFVLDVKKGYLSNWSIDNGDASSQDSGIEHNGNVNLQALIASRTPKRIDEIYYGITDNRYLFPWHLCKKGERVVIYGAGDVGRCFARQAARYSFIQLVGIVDRNWKNIHVRDLAINPPQKLKSWHYDVVIISIKDSSLYQSALNDLKKIGVSPKKIRWDGMVYDRDAFLQERYFNQMLTSGGDLSTRRRRILIETTYISSVDFGTGIQRTVNKIYESLMQERQYEVIPIVVQNGQVKVSHKYLGNDWKEGAHLELQAGDAIFFPDTSWGNLSEMKDLFAQARACRAELYVIVYDLIPFQRKELFDENFAKWINLVLTNAKAVIGITKTVAKDVCDFFRQQEIHRKIPLICYDFHLGMDIDKKEKGDKVRVELKRFLAYSKTFLMVGTIGNRKQQASVLDVFRDAWEKGEWEDRRLLVIGHVLFPEDAAEFVSSLEEDFVGRQNVLWIGDANDAEIQYAYQNAGALIQASLAEGLGLPLVEAAQYGLPIICSNLACFREVAGEHAVYFQTGDMDSLRDALVAWDDVNHPDSSNIKIYSWEDTAKEFLDILQEQKTPYKILY